MSARSIFARPARFAAVAPYLWMALFFLVPFGFVLKIALSQTAIAQPPYTPVFDLMEGREATKAALAQLSLDNFRLLISDNLYILSYLRSLGRGAGLDRDPAFDRLPDRLRHGAAAAALASHRYDAGNRAVLDLVPDPHLCLINILQHDGLPQQGAAGVAYHLSAAGVALDRQRDVSRHRLFLFAVHDPAASYATLAKMDPACSRPPPISRLAAAGILAR